MSKEILLSHKDLKFAVGNKVRIHKSLSSLRGHTSIKGLGLSHEMMKHEGMTTSIKAIVFSASRIISYYLDIDNGLHYWNDAMLESDVIINNVTPDKLNSLQKIINNIINL